MRAVHQAVDAAPVELRDEFGDRQDECGRARHLADEDQPGPRCHPPEDRVERLPRSGDRERDARDDHTRPVPLREYRDSLPVHAHDDGQPEEPPGKGPG